MMVKVNQPSPKSPNPVGSPLSLINNRWRKKIKGKIHYFGTYPSTTYEQAVAEYKRCKFDIESGIGKPTRRPDQYAVVDICDAFLRDRKDKISDRTWSDYRSVIEKFILPALGRERAADDLYPSDFKKVRQLMERSTVKGKDFDVSPKTVQNYCTRARAIVNFANSQQFTRQQISHGGYLANPAAKLLRRYENDKYEDGRDLSKHEIRDVLDIADKQMKAIILTALAAGMLEVDIAYLTFDHIDFETGLVNYPRRKTEIARQFVLWPEAIEAINAWRAVRPVAANNECEKYVFLTKYGNPWRNEQHRGCPLSREFKKLLRIAGYDRKGISFGALRKSFRTAVSIYTVDESDEKIADLICGHADSSMRSRYRQRVSLQKLERVGGYVREWLYGIRKPK